MNIHKLYVIKHSRNTHEMKYSNITRVNVNIVIFTTNPENFTELALHFLALQESTSDSSNWCKLVCCSDLYMSEIGFEHKHGTTHTFILKLTCPLYYSALLKASLL